MVTERKTTFMSLIFMHSSYELSRILCFILLFRSKLWGLKIEFVLWDGWRGEGFILLFVCYKCNIVFTISRKKISTSNILWREHDSVSIFFCEYYERKDDLCTKENVIIILYTGTAASIWNERWVDDSFFTRKRDT